MKTDTVSYDGSYGDYLVAHAERQIRLAVAEERRLKLLAQEAAWAARSPATRSTKQKARLKRLDELQSQRKLPKDRFLSLELQSQDKFGGALIDIIDLSFQYPNTQNLCFTISRFSHTWNTFGDHGTQWLRKVYTSSMHSRRNKSV